MRTTSTGEARIWPSKRRKRDTGPSGKVRQEIVDRDRCCQAHVYRFGLDIRCAGGLQIHHKTPRGMGGTSDPTINHPDNLVLLCLAHHAEVESNRTAAESVGLIIRRSSQ